MNNISNHCSCEITQNSSEDASIECSANPREMAVEFCTVRKNGQVLPNQSLDVGENAKIATVGIEGDDNKIVAGYCVANPNKNPNKTGGTYITVTISELDNPSQLYALVADVKAAPVKGEAPIVLNSEWIDYNPSESNNSCNYAGSAGPNLAKMLQTSGSKK